MPYEGKAQRVLLVDHESLMSHLVATPLRHQGFVVESATSGQEGIDLAKAGPFDVIILDLELPDISGLEVARQLRGAGIRVPILVLSALDSLEDKLAGLNAGADDYMTKPFALAELVARIRNIARRTNAEGVLRFGDIVMDEDAHRVFRAGDSIELTATEFNLLRYFMLNPRQVLSKARILREIWDSDFDGSGNVVELYVSYLRKKLERDGSPLIQTVRHSGYTLRGPD